MDRKLGSVPARIRLIEAANPALENGEIHPGDTLVIPAEGQVAPKTVSTRTREPANKTVTRDVNPTFANETDLAAVAKRAAGYRIVRLTALGGPQFSQSQSGVATLSTANNDGMSLEIEEIRQNLEALVQENATLASDIRRLENQQRQSESPQPERRYPISATPPETQQADTSPVQGGQIPVASGENTRSDSAGISNTVLFFLFIVFVCLVGFVLWMWRKRSEEHDASSVTTQSSMVSSADGASSSEAGSQAAEQNDSQGTSVTQDTMAPVSTTPQEGPEGASGTTHSVGGLDTEPATIDETPNADANIGEQDGTASFGKPSTPADGITPTQNLTGDVQAGIVFKPGSNESSSGTDKTDAKPIISPEVEELIQFDNRTRRSPALDQVGPAVGKSSNPDQNTGSSTDQGGIEFRSPDQLSDTTIKPANDLDQPVNVFPANADSSSDQGNIDFQSPGNAADATIKDSSDVDQPVNVFPPSADSSTHQGSIDFQSPGNAAGSTIEDSTDEDQPVNVFPANDTIDFVSVDRPVTDPGPKTSGFSDADIAATFEDLEITEESDESLSEALELDLDLHPETPPVDELSDEEFEFQNDAEASHTASPRITMKNSP